MKISPVQAPEIIPVPVPEGEFEPLYRIIVHNDDVTPMDFVIIILKRIFFIPDPDAVEIMLTAHSSGIAYVQTLPKAEAQCRISRAHFAAALESYPLHFSMEPE